MPSRGVNFYADLEDYWLARESEVEPHKHEEACQRCGSVPPCEHSKPAPAVAVRAAERPAYTDAMFAEDAKMRCYGCHKKWQDCRCKNGPE